MSLKKTVQTKENKLFKPADIVVYALILTITVALLIVFMFTRGDETLRASGAVAQISVKGNVVFEYDFGNDRYKTVSDEEKLEVSEGVILTVKVFTEDRKGYNEIAFHTSDGGKVTVTSANCSLRHDCTYMSISRAGDSIVCIPHDLTVSIKSAISPPATG